MRRRTLPRYDLYELLPADTFDPVRLAAAAYLARYKGWSRVHNESDLRCWLTWCAERQVSPLLAQRVHIELFIRWLEEVRHLKPATVARRTAILGGFYRTCVIDGVLQHSRAEYVRRPNVPAESPTLGLTHLQFEALLSGSRNSSNLNDFALVCLLGLLGLRLFEATGANINDLGEEHGHRVLRVCGKGDKIVLVPLPPAVARAVDHAAAHRVTGPLLLNRAGRQGPPSRHPTTPPPRPNCEHPDAASRGHTESGESGGDGVAGPSGSR